ncbi:putative glucan endo-1,3-beta-D-glucosidase [Helianthus annuus]|uniref:Glucan endo-1,3-beta-D-glucosidase n=2 Tax=Helianthus annuus TaxID=4232 RepID=A0A251TBR9_HELAN|nr:putative glucan endo-1,3-beta-D-glucosidase [Helianthus annuus]KAJ0502550.1 putative glucan endo-1,3-beta-D-glucosidase [Helianthus annuus]KAJ0510645.1 putative glucan endo-1,3-beta-D-glucosidase [Helianthus annuus]KAJ0518496.1 putative glucan endo-1,3-beta-D-glucosidase [Helianthus annuus]KAJ0686531.1 putative glucan endo-1,3-beta-D-glucosidase [Helianthus annuus]
MASTILLLGILISFFVSTDAQSVGVCYGEFGNSLPSQQYVVNLYTTNGITRMRIYAPNPATLGALGETDIELILDVPNGSLESLTDPNAATTWVRDNVLSYPDVNFRYIAVGNEVDPNNDNTRGFASFVLPAMNNVHNALRAVGLDEDIKVSTATYTGLLKKSYPPSEGVFDDNVLSFIKPIITFLAQNGSPMLANIYPYFAHVGPPMLPDLSFALFTKSTPAYSDQGRPYFNLFDAMYDAHYAAQSRLGGGNVEIVVSESGWPSAEGDVATTENAGTYYRNLISHVKSSSGTPARPGRSIETYLFAMFDENLKPGKETEKHFGVFLPDQRPKYQLSF